MTTERTAFVTKSEYKAIQQWEDDGGAPINIVYVIMPDDDVEQDSQDLPNKWESVVSYQTVKD
jgi:hypothetical protein